MPSLEVKCLIKVLVHPGICGFDAIIELKSTGQIVNLNISSKCESVIALADILTEVSLQDFSNRKVFTDNVVFKSADLCIHHRACPIPCAILKAVEAELGLALKKNVTIEFLQ
jgi:hypothetical protein